ncbi:hypothetical protein [Aminipila terrae]|uniref:DUF2931 family protein n=1 Tax=Aminipila terrae TaxID=2697030 RepID=A0A6P1ME69_9FIRM|nr:hypothetical protein [Aminipila terrae]QHI72197.1 hypothetical protein Ami3637_07110 [Aminipila terrae]
MLFIFLIICILLIIISYFSLNLYKPIEKRTMPEGLEPAFLQYCEFLLAQLKLKLKEVNLSQYKLLAEVPFEDGKFEFYSFEYTITPEKAVIDNNGIILNSRELLSKGGMKGKPVLLFFRQGDQDISEISFPDDKEIAHKGYKGYVNYRYANMKDWPVEEEYSLKIDDHILMLWENLKGDAPFPYAVQTRERTRDFLSYTAQYTDTWEGQGIKVNSWIQFEKKRELVYWIKSTNPVAETNRGIHVGSSLMDLKDRYRGDLAYDEDFKGAGVCYGFIPKDDTTRYIAFFVKNEKVTEIWITDAFDERPFKKATGYVENDVKWQDYDYSDKISERYAREIYVGQHKSDFDPDKVFNSFVAKELPLLVIVEHGILKDGPGEKTYYIVCQKKDSFEKFNIEVVLKRIKLEHSIAGEEIWVAEKYRSQMIMN